MASSPSVDVAKARNSYYPPYATGVDGRKQPVVNIPGSITVMSRQVLDDLQARTLGDALRSAAGVTVIGR